MTTEDRIADEVAGRIAQILRRNSLAEDNDVTVTVDGTTVTLGGSVKTWRECDEARQAAWSVAGVTEVVNDIVVTL